MRGAWTTCEVTIDDSRVSGKSLLPSSVTDEVRRSRCLHPDDAPVIIPALGWGQSSQDHHGVLALLGVFWRLHCPGSIDNVRQ